MCNTVCYRRTTCSCSSVAQSCLILCNPTDCTMPGFPVYHQLLELAQNHVHRVSYHPNISSSVVPFFSCLQSFPASESFPLSQFFVSGGQHIGASPSTSVLPMNIQDQFPLWWTGSFFLQFKGLKRVLSNTTVQKHQFFRTQFSLCPTITSIRDYWKNHSFDYTDLCCIYTT